MRKGWLTPGWSTSWAAAATRPRNTSRGVSWSASCTQTFKDTFTPLKVILFYLNTDHIILLFYFFNSFFLWNTTELLKNAHKRLMEARKCTSFCCFFQWHIKIIINTKINYFTLKKACFFIKTCFFFLHEKYFSIKIINVFLEDFKAPCQKASTQEGVLLKIKY